MICPHLIVHFPRLETELPDEARPGGRVVHTRQLDRLYGHVIILNDLDWLDQERLEVARRCPDWPILGAGVLVEVTSVHRHDRRDVIVVHELPQIGDGVGERSVRDDKTVHTCVRVDVQRVDVVRASGDERRFQYRPMTVARHDRSESVLPPVRLRQGGNRLRGFDRRHELLQYLETYHQMESYATVVLLKRTTLCSFCKFLETLNVGLVEWKCYDHMSNDHSAK